MKNHLVLLVACGLTFVVSPALAKDANMPVKPLTMSETFAEKHPSPGFSDEQLERVHAIKVKYDDVNDARDLELQKLYRQIFEGLNQQNLDKANLTSRQNKINSLEATAANDDLQMMIDLHDVLTPEQRTNLRRETLQQEAIEGGVGSAPMGRTMMQMCAPQPMAH
jgi:Spy/CpxP family protein refolding chaperone